ncbi:uncharacterized protein TNCV_1113461 [Trichonephila clavipes]|nr:uncharacterized protein TNCV_1113461 [Trichonephila clavipes]
MSTKKREIKPSNRKTKKLKSSGTNANKTSDSDENQALVKEKNDLFRQIDFLNSIILDTKLKEPNKSFVVSIISSEDTCSPNEIIDIEKGETINITSPGFQEFHYPANSLCSWTTNSVSESNRLEVSEELGIAQSVISRLWQRFQDDGNVSRCYRTGRPRVTTPNEDRYLAVTAKKKQTEHSIRPVSSALFSYRYDRLKADRVQTLRAHWSRCS